MTKTHVLATRDSIIGIVNQETGIPLGEITDSTRLLGQSGQDRSAQVMACCNARFGQNKPVRLGLTVADVYQIFVV